MLYGRKTMFPDLVIFNSGTDLEFGECQVCGYEINPPKHDYGWRYVYPTKCPNCKAAVHAVKAEDKK